MSLCGPCSPCTAPAHPDAGAHAPVRGLDMTSDGSCPRCGRASVWAEAVEVIVGEKVLAGAWGAGRVSLGDTERPTMATGVREAVPASSSTIGDLVGKAEVKDRTPLRRQKTKARYRPRRKQMNRFTGDQRRNWLLGVTVCKNAIAAWGPLDLGLKMPFVSFKEF